MVAYVDLIIFDQTITLSLPLCQYWTTYRYQSQWITAFLIRLFFLTPQERIISILNVFFSGPFRGRLPRPRFDPFAPFPNPRFRPGRGGGLFEGIGGFGPPFPWHLFNVHRLILHWKLVIYVLLKSVQDWECSSQVENVMKMFSWMAIYFVCRAVPV